VREINVFRAGDPVHAGDKAGLTGMLLRDLIWVANIYTHVYIFRNLVVYILKYMYIVTSQML
jgi:uncharacterized membrane protein